MKIIINVFVVFAIFSCTKRQNYNPFDDQFDMPMSSLIEGEFDTIPVCGCYNFIEKKGKLKMYYQVFPENLNEAVAKGIDYPIDTFKVNEAYKFCCDEFKIDSIMSLPMDITAMNEEFGRFGYKVTSKSAQTIQIFNADLDDKAELRVIVYPIDEQYVIRDFDYSKSKRHTQNPSFLDWLKERIRDIGQTEVMEETEEIVEWEEIEETEDTEE